MTLRLSSWAVGLPASARKVLAAILSPGGYANVKGISLALFAASWVMILPSVLEQARRRVSMA